MYMVLEGLKTGMKALAKPWTSFGRVMDTTTQEVKMQNGWDIGIKIVDSMT